MSDRGNRRYHSERIVRKRIKALIDWWGRKGEFGWENIHSGHFLFNSKRRYLKQAKTKHPFAQGAFGKDPKDYRDIKDAKRGSMTDGY